MRAEILINCFRVYCLHTILILLTLDSVVESPLQLRRCSFLFCPLTISFHNLFSVIHLALLFSHCFASMWDISQQHICGPGMKKIHFPSSKMFPSNKMSFFVQDHGGSCQAFGISQLTVVQNLQQSHEPFSMCSQNHVLNQMSLHQQYLN